MSMDAMKKLMEARATAAEAVATADKIKIDVDRVRAGDAGAVLVAQLRASLKKLGQSMVDVLDAVPALLGVTMPTTALAKPEDVAPRPQGVAGKIAGPPSLLETVTSAVTEGIESMREAGKGEEADPRTQAMQDNARAGVKEKEKDEDEGGGEDERKEPEQVEAKPAPVAALPPRREGKAKKDKDKKDKDKDQGEASEAAPAQ